MTQKVTLITTVKNEERSISLFLESLERQVKKPDEVIIVDGGSKDNTISEIQKRTHNFKLFIKKGNRSVGRNYAIKNAKHQIIAVTDAGCILDKNWLHKITDPFSDKRIDVVAGYYLPKTSNVFEKSLAAYTCVMPDKLNKNNFLPSSRSVAFKKSTWEKVGGYPEYLDTCEDLVFARNLKKAGYRFYTETKAVVYWPQRKNIWSAAKQFFNYAKGDGQANYIRKNTYILLLRYILGIFFVIYIFYSKQYFLFVFLFIALILYVLWAIRKNYKYVRHWKGYFYLPLLQFVSDFTVILGIFVGFSKRLLYNFD